MTKVEEILIAAEDEFYRNGYNGTSMVTVARRAGVTHAMVNYYFRSKEQLFLKILDSHTYTFIERLRSIMKENADFIQTAVDAADSIFDVLNDDRKFPFLIQDVARSAPELLERYRTPVETSVRSLLENHSSRLAAQIEAGAISETSMKGLLENLIYLVVSPFLLIPTLENVCGMSADRIDDYLSRRKKEIETLIRARYTLAALPRDAENPHCFSGESDTHQIATTM